MEMLHKSFALSVKATDDAARTIQGYAATYGNVDLGGDMIVAGAFTDSLKVRMPKMLSQHDTCVLPGIWTKATDDSNGLLLDGLFANTPTGNEHYELTKMGALDRLSIGYTVVDAEYATVDGQSVRILKTLDLWEVSIVTFPMNEQARITNVKNAHDNERDFEKFLREAGYSRDAAKIITARGFKALSGQREAEAEEVRQLAHLLNQFQPLTTR
jgi:uncharacterized protein